MQEGILVLLSSYNGEKYIKEQILSIINQKIDCKVDIRIRDDGSGDNTCKVVEELIEQYPDRIQLIRGENVGYNKSFFELIKGANGYKYYSISDQDDVWKEDKLDVAKEWLDKETDDIPLLYASTSYLVYDDLVPYGTTRKKVREFSIYNTIIQNICPGHTQVFNNKLLGLLQVDIDTSKIYVYDSWITNVAMLYGKILFNNESYTYYRQHRANQLGYGKGVIGQLLSSAKRTKTNDGGKYRRQIEYFSQLNEKELRKKDYLYEINKFVNSKVFFKRVGYAFVGKLYRQKKIESVAFYVANIIGKF
ncbi:MAG: glycosyltransferase [Lachnospiraceae bacterium]|nr:glycosyltransferase [Lachnospiraceae bacterium]